MKTKQAAALMGKSEEFIRAGLRSGRLPFGYAVKSRTRWNYYISPVKFTEYTGIEVSE